MIKNELIPICSAVDRQETGKLNCCLTLFQIQQELIEMEDHKTFSYPEQKISPEKVPPW